MKKRAPERFGLWTLPDLWKAPSDLSTRSLENAFGVYHSAHRPYWDIYRECLESMRKPVQY
ncbi:MAG: hypothetical protein H6Q06_2480 [Acidobacteria bacterium]|jgi:hypothetical protein|nr:hypothetical protein [Acidobacteriota bacterium]